MADQELAKLVVKLEAESSKLHKDLQSTQRIIRRFENDTRKSIAGVTGAFKSMAGILVGAGVGQAMVSTIRTTEVLKSSLETVTGSTKAAGAAFEELQQFAAQTPFSLTEVTQAFVRLKALGLEPTTELLTSFGNTASAFGTSLMQYSEAVADAITGEFERLKEFGIRASSQGENVAFTFRGVTTVVKKNADEIKSYLTEIGDSDFAGAMERRADSLDGALSNLADSFQRLTVAVGDMGLTSIVRRVAEFLSNSVDDVLAFGRAVNTLYNTIFGVTGKLSDLYEERIDLEAKLAALENGPGGGRGRTAQELDNRLQQVESLIFQYERLIENQDIALDSPAAPVRISVTGGTSSAGISDSELKRLESLAKRLQQPMDQLQAELADLDALVARGMISWDEYGEAVFDSLDKVGSKASPVKDQFEDLKQAIEGWGRDFADTLLEAGGSMTDFVDSVLQQLARIALAKTLDPFFNLFGGWVANSVPDLFGGFRATGGPVSGGTSYVVGERGPELFVPSTSGSIIPNGALGGSGVVVNVINNVSGAQASTRERQENGMTVIDVMVEQVKSAIAGDISRGSGSVPSALQGAYGLNRVAGAY